MLTLLPKNLIGVGLGVGKGWFKGGYLLIFAIKGLEWGGNMRNATYPCNHYNLLRYSSLDIPTVFILLRITVTGISS